jgi:nucleoside 2-deoxyribosyltransferase
MWHILPWRHKMKLYIAGHDQEIANDIASRLSATGHEITASWLFKPFHPTKHHTAEERVDIAVEDFNDIARADALVIISSDRPVPGGKFVEAGIALGLGKKIFLIGDRENMLMWHPKIRQIMNTEEIA